MIQTPDISAFKYIETLFSHLYLCDLAPLQFQRAAQLWSIQIPALSNNVSDVMKP